MHIPAIFRLPFAVPFWLVFFLVFVRENRVVRQALPDASSAQDAGTLRLLMLGSPLAMLAGVGASFLPWLDMTRPVAAVAAGVVMLLAGGLLRRCCFVTLGKYFTGTVAVTPGQQVIQHGVYRLVNRRRIDPGIGRSVIWTAISLAESSRGGSGPLSSPRRLCTD